MSETTANQDPAAIEQDIRRTQDDMSRTVERISDQLSPRKLLDSLVGTGEGDGEIDTRKLLDAAKRNPPAAAMVALGGLWLLSGREAKMPSMPSMPSFGSSGSSSGGPDYTSYDPEHRDYLSHMNQVEQRENEDPTAYQRRRDLARANYFMVERNHDEDESSFRKRLDEAAEGFRQRRSAFADKTRRMGHNVSAMGQNVGQGVSAGTGQAVERGQQLYAQNPWAGGLLAAAVGAFVGALVPLTRTEEQQLASVGGKVRDLADQGKDRLTTELRDRKDTLVDKAEQKLGDAGDGGQSSGQSESTGMGSAEMGSTGVGQPQVGGLGATSTTPPGSPYPTQPLPVT
jgi:ElaB/YqjD/DUF883 family membrane-anchored ribosome-binding protein